MEELEIGDYINDINSYHLHMFDKHDVTTKKLDVIVEKAGKVDANYAAQIEGYCSLLGEYGKKFEAVGYNFKFFSRLLISVCFL